MHTSISLRLSRYVYLCGELAHEAPRAVLVGQVEAVEVAAAQDGAHVHRHRHDVVPLCHI